MAKRFVPGIHLPPGVGKTHVGAVYACTNEALEGFVKIGKTTNRIEVRIASLNAHFKASLGLPKFRVEFYAKTKNCHHAEHKLHDYFNWYQLNEGKFQEFFFVDLRTVREAFISLVGEVTDCNHAPFKPRLSCPISPSIMNILMYYE